VSVTEHKIKVGSLEWFYRESLPIGRTDLVPVVLLHGLPSHSYSWRKICQHWQGTRASRLTGLVLASPQNQSGGICLHTCALLPLWLSLSKRLKSNNFLWLSKDFLGSVGLQYALSFRSEINLAILNTQFQQMPWKMQQCGLPCG